ncbi:complex III assembly factor LYRM7-like [Homalodisca vitripennis]|uniref:complex III assembly factor LYRM7-like n=1 Tax=Homalodisca vitripennis TaxID=197043 RepID=UPI001EEA51D3|nr:complex III assembly factor LYRM7-like [Homalodisca vitripennis]XP_046683765.1 complex III assembly factor LYRM7-like [Homalodisca vitripennis]
MSGKIRRDVLKAFKSLHRARTSVFNGDEFALQVARNKINEEFEKNKHITDENVIREMIKYSKEVEMELRTTVVQAKEIEPGKYEVRITEDTAKMENIPFQDVPEEVLLTNKRKASTKCSGKQSTLESH